MYKKRHKFSHEDNIEHNRSKIRALHPIIIDKNLIIAIFSLTVLIIHNLVIEINKIVYMNCSIIAILMDIILSIIGNIFEHCSKA